MPPVANTLMPAPAAEIIVAATVVAPVRPSAMAESEIGARQLHGVRRLRKLFELLLVEADMQHPVDHGDGGGEPRLQRE